MTESSLPALPPAKGKDELRVTSEQWINDYVGEAPCSVNVDIFNEPLQTLGADRALSIPDIILRCLSDPVEFSELQKAASAQGGKHCENNTLDSFPNNKANEYVKRDESTPKVDTASEASPEKKIASENFCQPLPSDSSSDWLIQNRIENEMLLSKLFRMRSDDLSVPQENMPECILMKSDSKRLSSAEWVDRFLLNGGKAQPNSTAKVKRKSKSKPKPKVNRMEPVDGDGNGGESSHSSDHESHHSSDHEIKLKRDAPGIKEPLDEDVICGRGGKGNHHVGNKRYRGEIKRLKDKYKSCSRKDKTNLSRSIVDKVHKYGGRFVVLKSTTNLWYEVEDCVARRKTSQAFRESEKTFSSPSKRLRVSTPIPGECF